MIDLVGFHRHYLCGESNVKGEEYHKDLDEAKGRVHGGATGLRTVSGPAQLNQSSSWGAVGEYESAREPSWGCVVAAATSFEQNLLPAQTGAEQRCAVMSIRVAFAGKRNGRGVSILEDQPWHSHLLVGSNSISHLAVNRAGSGCQT